MADLGSALQSVLQVPGLQELLNSSITRNRELEPVRTAVSQQAVNMLPNSAFNRPNIGAIPRANYTTPAPTDSGGTDWAKILSLLGAGAAGGGLLAKLLGGGGGSGGNGGGSGGNLSNLVNGIRNFLGRNNPNNWPMRPGDGFGGDHTSTYGSRDPFGSNLPSFENGFFNDPTFFTGVPNDPSGGTGIGPGMQDFRNSGSGGSSLPDENSWGDD